MFYRFFVKPEHRDYLRFFWFQDNNPDLPMIEYRMTVHVFGNRPSPAVATYGLREAVKNSEEESKPLLVNGLSTTGAVNTNESVLRFHVSPKLC
jgi:hypothetical protein